LRAHFFTQQAQLSQRAVASMNTHQPTSSAIQSVEFGFLSTNDVRTLSVKRITNPTTFDSLLHPVAGGLHDAALGAFLDNP
jgi:DNA-directed RNA polymerase beta' subunit